MARKCHAIANVPKAFSLKRWRYLRLDCGNAELEKGNIIPKGHIPVYVGSERRRFIIPTSHLNHPLFGLLLRKAEEEFGFEHQLGLTIPCEEDVFEYLISLMAAGKDAEGHVTTLDDLNLEWLNSESVNLFGGLRMGRGILR